MLCELRWRRWPRSRPRRGLYRKHSKALRPGVESDLVSEVEGLAAVAAAGTLVVASVQSEGDGKKLKGKEDVGSTFRLFVHVSQQVWQ